MTLGKETVAILNVIRAHPGVVDDALRITQCPARISMRLTFRATANDAAAALRRLLRRKRAWPEALLECRFLAARMDARRTAARCARIAPPCKCESLHARPRAISLTTTPS